MKQLKVSKSFVNQEGQSLFEVTVALAVVAIILVAVVGVSSISVRNATYSRSQTLAARHSQETIEWLRSQRDAGWSEFIGYAAIPVRCLPSLSWTLAKVGHCSETDVIPGSIFKREVTLSVNGGVVEAEVAVSWDDGQGAHDVKVSTSFTDWRQN